MERFGLLPYFGIGDQNIIVSTLQLGGYNFWSIGVFYVTKIGKNGNTKKVRFDNKDENLSTKIRFENNSYLPSRTMMIFGINMCRGNQIKDEVEEGTNCNLVYMILARNVLDM